LAIAESFRVHEWQANEANVKHGIDRRGVPVHTPDLTLERGIATRRGWWKPGDVNIGVPYKWGGFDTPNSFSAGLKRGAYAGDVYTEKKREGIYGEVSYEACGVDCSGFVSRCWRLQRAYSTREIPKICEELASFDDLKAGDVVNKRDKHVILFEKWLDDEKARFMAYETGSEFSWKVVRHPVLVKKMKGLGYTPYRYRKIKD